MTRVLQIIDSGGLYGAERILLALMEALDAQGISCSLASIAEPGQPEKALEAEARHRGLDVRRHTMAAGPDRDATRRLLLDARNEGFDLLHTHGYKANTLISGLPRKKRGLPAIATLHGWTATRLWSRVGVYEMVERQALRRADRIVAVSEAMVRKWKLDSRYKHRLSVIRNGVPSPGKDNTRDQMAESLLSFVAGRRSIFAAGRLSHEKGFDLLLEALAAIRTNGLDACLVLAGEGRERRGLEDQARDLGVEHAVLMPGYVENARQIMGNFEVVAIPSRTEGLPVVLLEALMAGVGVAATAVGEMPAVMQLCDSGPCAEPNSADSLRIRIEALFNEVRQHPRSANVATTAKRLFSSQVMASAYLNLYRELLSRP